MGITRRGVDVGKSLIGGELSLQNVEKGGLIGNHSTGDD